MITPSLPVFDPLAYIEAVLAAELPERVKRVLLYLETLTDDLGWAYGPYASHRYMSLDCGYAQTSTVVRTLGEAEAAGWLQKFRSVGTAANSYRLLIPATYPAIGEVP